MKSEVAMHENNIMHNVSLYKTPQETITPDLDTYPLLDYQHNHHQFAEKHNPTYPEIDLA